MDNLYDESYSRGELIKTVASTTVPERITSRTISSIARSGSTRRCLVTTSVAHGYVNGARVYISGAVETEFNNLTTGWMITVLSSTTFIFFAAGSSASASGSPVCYADMFVRQATVLGQKAAQTDNTGNVRLGVASANAAQPYLVTPGREVYLNYGMPDESRINLGSYYVDVDTNDDGVVVLYS